MSGIIEEMRTVVTEIIGDDKKSSDIIYALIKRFGGERLYFPNNDYESRNKEIRRLYKKGMEIKKLASRFRLSPRTVSRIVK